MHNTVTLNAHKSIAVWDSQSMEVELSDFAGKLEEYRKRSGLSRSALARAVGVDASYMSRLEANERRPSNREFVLNTARALRLNHDECNVLLKAADYAPVSMEDTMEAHPAVKLLADILNDEQIPQDEKDLIERQLRQIQKRWHERRKT
jgi:transcriptional regulator with XRE-family HTH domain